MLTHNNDGIINYNKGTKYLNSQTWEKADRYFGLAHRSGLASPELFLNWGNVKKALGDYSGAATLYEKCRALKPDYKLVYNNLGLIYHGMGRETTAMEIFNEGGKIDPGYKDLKWNRSLTMLKMASTAGEGLAEAWKEYEIRFFKESSVVKLKCDFGTLPHWKGERDARVMVIAEQGIGDAIQFARYINHYGVSRGITFGFQCGDVLHRLLKDVIEPRHVVSEYLNWKDYDYFIPLCSLAAVGEIAPSMFIPRIADAPRVGRIGFVWQGNPEHGNDYNRSVSVGYFKRFLKYDAVPLQWKGEAFGIKSPCVGDFKDTQRVLSGIDLLISVDTSIVHLAGSMGVPTWCIMPKFDSDWRWGTTGEKSIWYDSVRIIRNSGDWLTVFDRIENDLKNLPV